MVSAATPERPFVIRKRIMLVPSYSLRNPIEMDALDGRAEPPDNDLVRARSLLILLALATLAGAGQRSAHERAPVPPVASVVQVRLHSAPTPDTDLPATLTVGLRESAYLQSSPAMQDRPHARPATVAAPAPDVLLTASELTARPLTFPLRI
jgi:hypothetical protein